jgi:inorganic pyrophosphatase
MTEFLKLPPFDKKGRLRVVVETPRGSAIKYTLNDELGIFTVSRSLSLGVTYPFDWGFVPGTEAEDGDPVDAMCVHPHASFPGAVLPCRCVALLDVDQQSSRGRVRNPRLIVAPAWEGGDTLAPSGLSNRDKAQLETFFLNATLFTDKDARILGWQDAAAAEAYVRQSLI